MGNDYARLDSPNYASDYVSIFVNGLGEFPYSLPGVTCPVCKDSWAGIRRISHYLPESLRERIRSVKPNIPSAKFKPLALEIMRGLSKEGITSYDPLPGDSFLPLVARFPSRPRYDFLWPALGCAVVSPRVKRVFEKNDVTGVSFHDIEVKAIGAMEPDREPPMPSSGEPEDIISVVRREINLKSFLPLYLLVVEKESGLPPGVIDRGRCPECSYPYQDTSHRKMCLTPEIIPDTDIFFLSTTLYIIVSEKVQRLVKSHRFANVNLTPFHSD